MAAIVQCLQAQVKKLFSKEGTNSHLQTSLFLSAMSLQWESGLDPFSLLIRGRKPFINHDFACRPLSKPSDETFMSSAEGAGKKLLRCLLYFSPKIELFLSASAGKWRDFLCICICICLCTFTHFGSQGKRRALMGLSCPELRSLC